MKVLHVIPSLVIGGAQTLLVELLKQTKLHNQQVDLFVLQQLDHLTPIEEQIRALEIQPIYGAFNSPYLPKHLYRLYLYLKNHHYDIVHAYATPSQLWLAVLKKWKLKNLRLVTTENSAYNRRRKTFFKPFDKFLYQQYAHIICGSTATAHALTTWLPEVKVKSHIIDNGIDLQKFAPRMLRKRLNNLSSEQLIVLFVARFEEPKDQATCIRAAQHVPNMQLFLVGDGPLRASCEQLTKQLNLTGRVHFLGDRADVPDLYASADVCVHSSGWEGMSMTILEAMASGLPIVATEVPGIQEHIRGIGQLFPLGDVNALVQILQQLSQNEDLRATLAAQSLAEVKKYSIESVYEGYYAVYNNLLSEQQLDTAIG